MLSSIHPFGERSRNSRWWLTVTAYLIGSAAGGLSMAALAAVIGLGLRSALSAPAALLVLGVAGLVGLAADLGIGPLRVPGIRRQVNERWLTQYRGWVYGGGFGYQLGLGVATIVTTSTIWITWLAASLTGSIHRALLIGGVFGLARGSFIFATTGIHHPDRLRTLHQRIDRHAGTVHNLALSSAAITALGAGTIGLSAL